MVQAEKSAKMENKEVSDLRVFVTLVDIKDPKHKVEAIEIPNTNRLDFDRLTLWDVLEQAKSQAPKQGKKLDIYEHEYAISAMQFRY